MIYCRFILQKSHYYIQSSSRINKKILIAKKDETKFIQIPNRFSVFVYVFRLFCYCV